MKFRAVCLLLCAAAVVQAQQYRKDAVAQSFEVVWTTLRDQYWDSSMNGLNWQKVHDEYLPKVEAAKNVEQARQVMNQMIHKLPSSHLALIPAEVYGDAGVLTAAAGDGESQPRIHAPGAGTTGLAITEIDGKMVVEHSENPDVGAGWIVKSIDGENVENLRKLAARSDVKLTPRLVEDWLNGRPGSAAQMVFVRGDGTEAAVEVTRHLPPGKLVAFSNLPPLRVIAEHRKLASGVGYIRLNVFLDPVSVMPEFERAVEELRSAPGIVLDLRGNPGGLGIMAMGIAGWFVAEDGAELGTLITRNSKEAFLINPRIEPYGGKLAILVDGESASTSEILAQGLKDLGRARIFGSRTEGAALLSEFIELPDGDRFQYPEANYVSFKGRVLEGNGVEPDVSAPPTVAALLAGHDRALEAGEAWSLAK